ncbi:hypothetical protein E2562_034188 [Oryza meyeriana var. granulata]|uniref:Uncharacterized protein n=1 Tax=Oryza meyeriana var. granulata TaxID=110450 RepID=A0A6G1F197_9ORYZ|nr:hypothetical protein E2562_034188 [Oryza meyeriana var. granulata]
MKDDRPATHSSLPLPGLFSASISSVASHGRLPNHVRVLPRRAYTIATRVCVHRPVEVRAVEDEVEDRGVALGEVDTAVACVAVTSTSWSTRHRHRSTRKSRRRPRAAHRPIEEEKDGGAALREVKAVAARVAGEARDEEGRVAVLREVEDAAVREAAEAMAMNRQRSGHGWSRY